MHEHSAHAQRVGHQAGVLPPRAAKALQGVARHIVATRHRDLLDGVGHLLHGDVDEALGHGFGRAPRACRQLREALLHHLSIQRLIAAQPKHLRKPSRLDLADHYIGVGYRQRAAAPVAGRPRVGPRALRPHPEARTIEFQDGASAGGHGVDAHHRRAHPHTRHLGLELAFEFAGVVAHVGRGAAHVEADHPLVPSQCRRSRHAHDAARGPGKNRVLAMKHRCVGQAARGLHEEQPHTRHLGGHLVHIAPQDGAEVGIHHGGVAAADELHQGTRFMRGADLQETHLAGDAGRCGLVRREAPSVQKDNGHTAQPGVEGSPQAFAQVRFIECL